MPKHGWSAAAPLERKNAVNQARKVGKTPNAASEATVAVQCELSMYLIIK